LAKAEDVISDRTLRSTVTFAHPFTLRCIDGIRPAGTYAVETDEELVLGLTVDAYRRTATYLFLSGRPGESIVSEVFHVDPEELRRALAEDAAATS
jgi:hypothetical protein